MNLFKTLIYMYLLLRPYYFFSSGSLQISDFALILAFFVFLLQSASNKKIIINNIQKNREFLIFTLLVIIINGIYYIIYGDFTFIKSSLFFIFNFIVIILFSNLIEDSNFLVKMSKIMKLNLLIQLLICITKIGRIYGGVRYMGTFNDPNQFAYFVLTTYSIFFLLNYKEKNMNLLLYLLITVFLIIQSGSTGMLLGVGVFVIFEIIAILKNIPRFFKKYLQYIIGCAYIILLLFSIYELVIFANPSVKNDVKNRLSNINIVTRLNNKLVKANKSQGNLWQERGYDRIYYYPKYLIFGFGEGNYSRLSLTYHHGELHATFPSILFCYGIIPFLILIKWIYKKMKKIPLGILVIYIALFAESFTLQNERQSLFWIIVLLASLFRKEGEMVEQN